MGVKMSNTILVIEDNEQNMYLVTFMLERHGYKVLQAQTGKEGLVLAQENPIDLILLDIQLPELDGYTIAQMLREVEKLKNIPIIAVTSYAMTGDKEKALASGCSGYIEKPINPDTFMKEVQQFL
jgi:two-component system, cell cycle response regulator DivK